MKLLRVGPNGEERPAARTAEGLACVVGCVVSHDVSEREIQLERGGPWDKNCETFNPLGPRLVDRWPGSAAPACGAGLT